MKWKETFSSTLLFFGLLVERVSALNNANAKEVEEEEEWVCEWMLARAWMCGWPFIGQSIWWCEEWMVDKNTDHAYADNIGYVISSRDIFHTYADNIHVYHARLIVKYGNTMVWRMNGRQTHRPCICVCTKSLYWIIYSQDFFHIYADNIVVHHSKLVLLNMTI